VPTAVFLTCATLLAQVQATPTSATMPEGSSTPANPWLPAAAALAAALVTFLGGVYFGARPRNKAETAKLDAEKTKLEAETAKLEAETAKLNREEALDERERALDERERALEEREALQDELSRRRRNRRGGIGNGGAS
jgi:uncharacterized protein HemX